MKFNGIENIRDHGPGKKSDTLALCRPDYSLVMAEGILLKEMDR